MLWDDGILLQVCKVPVQSQGDGILNGVSLPVGKLEGVEFGRESRANVPPPICQNIT